MGNLFTYFFRRSQSNDKGQGQKLTKLLEYLTYIYTHRSTDDIFL